MAATENVVIIKDAFVEFGKKMSIYMTSEMGFQEVCHDIDMEVNEIVVEKNFDMTNQLCVAGCSDKPRPC